MPPPTIAATSATAASREAPVPGVRGAFGGTAAGTIDCSSRASVKVAGRARIDTINNLINGAIRYTSDLEQHGMIDVWLSPLATLASGRGDCKDYAIAKYVALRDAGVALEDLRLLVVHDRSVQQDHAVVAVRDKGRWLILDNRYSRLLEAAEAHQFLPLFAIDQEGVNLLTAPYAGVSSHETHTDVALTTSTSNAVPRASM
jgi:predicted transglutaminase-like cysteine proteinase